jgi:hypothetical protein
MMKTTVEADEALSADMGRAFDIMDAIAGQGSDAPEHPLSLLVGLVCIVYGYTHGKDAMDDWAARLGRFASTYPVVDPEATRADLDRLVEAANRVNKAWAAAEPKLATRAVHLVAWSGAIQMLGEIHGPGAAEAFVRMTKEWAAVWDSSAAKN